MNWNILVSLVDTGKLAGWVRAIVAALLGAAIAKWPALSSYLDPTAQAALGVVVSAIIVGAWSHVAKWLTAVPQKAVIAFLVLAAACALSCPAPAYAATVAAPALTPQSVAKKIQSLVKPDLSYAIQLATAAGTVQSKVRLQCYQAISDALPSPPSGASAPPAPHLITDVEQLAELVDALQPTSPVFVNCAGAAQLASLSVLSFINAVVTGALGVATAVK